MTKFMAAVQNQMVKTAFTKIITGDQTKESPYNPYEYDNVEYLGTNGPDMMFSAWNKGSETKGFFIGTKGGEFDLGRVGGTTFIDRTETRPDQALTIFIKYIARDGTHADAGESPQDFDNVVFLARSGNYYKFPDLFAAWDDGSPEHKLFYLGIKGNEAYV